jgi:hypothetical protein
VPKHEGRILKLRTGADDELTQIDAAPVETTPQVKSKPKAEASLVGILDLSPSKELTQPPQFNPLQIFVSQN